MKRILVIIFYCCIINVVLCQSGQYFCEYYVWYNNDGTSEYTSDNPEETFHKYIIDISISPLYNFGTINIKDVDSQVSYSYEITGKLKDYSDANGTGRVYAATLKVYGQEQTATVLLIYDVITLEIQHIVVTSIEFGSKGHYIDLVPVANISNSYGSGFIINNSGYIITNYHVISGAKSIKIKGISGDNETSYPAQLIDYDEINDIALLKIISGNYNVVFNISKRSAEIGDDVFVLGYPMITVMGSEIKLTSGIISSLSGYKTNPSYYQISAPIQPGNSGCPLFDYDGNIIGLISAKLSIGENVSYALKSSILFDFISKNGVVLPLNTSIMEIPSFTQKIKLLKQNVIYIESYR